MGTTRRCVRNPDNFENELKAPFRQRTVRQRAARQREARQKGVCDRASSSVPSARGVVNQSARPRLPLDNRPGADRRLGRHTSIQHHNTMATMIPSYQHAIIMITANLISEFTLNYCNVVYVQGGKGLCHPGMAGWHKV